MATESDNFARLEQAGIMRMGRDECPDEYVEVIDRLSEDQVGVLLDVWERLQAAGPAADTMLTPGEEPHWISCMFF